MKTIALVGNPNSGKTTLFNKLTGSSQRVGNWPGVTIDRKEGKLKGLDDYTVVDLPGIYSLSPYSPEEVVSRDYIVNEKPDMIVNVVDASNLERNLYLTVQLLEMDIPSVVVLNMMDIAESKGITINVASLEKELGCRIVTTTAVKNRGVDDIKNVVSSVSGGQKAPVRFDEDVENALDEISEKIDIEPSLKRWASIKAFERDPAVEDKINGDVSEIIEKIEEDYDDSSESIITDQRYTYICEMVSRVCKVDSSVSGETLSDKIDKIVTNKWLGLPIFIGIMYLVYYISISTIGTMGTDWVNDTLFGEWILPGVSDWLASNNVDAVISGFIVDGLIGGVGAVLGFLPQMLVLFLILVILEDCGYMARIAFVMDRIFRRFGLSGKSFIPVLVGTGCGVPGVMASRTIESERDRRITAMTTTFIPCSAKMPIIALIAGALFGGSALVALSAYFLGVLCILVSGIILKKWKSLSGDPAPFIMELPPYHVPLIINVIRSTLERGWAFVKKAGTFILLACAVVWFLSTFDFSFKMVDDINSSMLASIGNAIGFIFSPLGFGDWEFTVATITGLLAKENVVGTFGVLFGIEGVSEAGEEIWTILSTRITPVAGYAFLAFNLICAPCFAAIGAIRRELGTWKSTGYAVLYQTVLAYGVALMIYQFGTLICYGTFSIGVISAVIVLLLLGYVLIAKDPFKNGTSEVQE